MELTGYDSPLPYPGVHVECENKEWARMMLSNIGGSNSELSAVTLYFYNHLVTSGYDDLTEMFHKISIVEMRHLEIFGHLAWQLGADPRPWSAGNRSMQYWTAGNNTYIPADIPALLQNALEAELAAIDKYERQAAAIRNQNIVENLSRIIVDEKIHVEIFKSFLS